MNDIRLVYSGGSPIRAAAVSNFFLRETRPIASLIVQVGQPIIQEGRQNFIVLHLSRNKNSV